MCLYRKQIKSLEIIAKRFIHVKSHCFSTLTRPHSFWSHPAASRAWSLPGHSGTGCPLAWTSTAPWSLFSSPPGWAGFTSRTRHSWFKSDPGCFLVTFGGLQGFVVNGRHFGTESVTMRKRLQASKFCRDQNISSILIKILLELHHTHS